MVAKFVINGKVLKDLIDPNEERTINGILSYDGKTLQFLDCKSMSVRLTQKLKPINREKVLFRSKKFGDVLGLGSKDYLVVITNDVIRFYNGEEKEENELPFEIEGHDYL